MLSDRFAARGRDPFGTFGRAQKFFEYFQDFRRAGFRLVEDVSCAGLQKLRRGERAERGRENDDRSLLELLQRPDFLQQVDPVYTRRSRVKQESLRLRLTQ